MSPNRILGCLGAALLCSGPAIAQVEPLTELKFDLNADLVLSGAEIEAYLLHKENPVIAAIDIDFDGVITPAELATYVSAAKVKVAPKVAALNEQWSEAGGVPVTEVLRVSASDPSSPCNKREGWYVRRDRFDLQTYNSDLAKAQGAAIRINDNLNGRTTGSIDGLVSYVFRNPCIDPGDDYESGPYLAGYVVAPWLQANGAFFDTANPNPANKVKFGLDTQYAVAEGHFPFQYLTAAPYFQTDFAGASRIYGFDASWTPYDIGNRLGGAIAGTGPLDYYFDVRAETDVRYVEGAGQTGLTPNTAQAWLGARVGLKGWLFPARMGQRVPLSVGYAYHWEAISRRTAELVTASIAWNFTSDTSISLGFSAGVDKDTLRRNDFAVLSLNFKR
jgi:hypothetical protein